MSRERWLALGIAGIVSFTWWLSHLGLYTPESDIGYALGLTGGVMMLLLFAYPLRKHLRFLQGLGKTKYWFLWHMVLGILGPTFILLHSTYAFGSINATVAFSTMVIVSLSGVVGRFMYARIHHGLYGRRASLREMQTALSGPSETVHSKFHFAPNIEARLQAFETMALAPATGWARAWRFMTLALRSHSVKRACKAELKQIAKRLPQLQMERAIGIISEYLDSVHRVAQFTVYERLFALWHVLHVPLVYMLVLCAVAHVVAVHIY